MIPLLDKNSVKSEVISILGKRWPLTLKEIHQAIKKEYLGSATKQAIFKALKELSEQGVLAKEGKKYSVNMKWANDVYKYITSIRLNYIIKSKVSGSKMPVGTIYGQDLRIVKFVEEVGPQAIKYFDKPGCILAVCGSGACLGLALKQFLYSKGIYVNYSEIDRHRIKLNRRDVGGRKILVVDSAIYSGTTIRRIKKQVSSLKKKFKIKDLKIAVGHDMIGLADWSCQIDPDITFY